MAYSNKQALALAMALLTAFLLSFNGCTTQQSTPAVTAPAKEQLRTALIIAILFDRTGSWSTTQAETMQLEDVTPLIELLRSNGGELAVGLIRNRSNRGLLRLRLSAPPEPPAKPIGNPLKAAEQLAGYQKKLAAYKRQEEERQRTNDERVKLFISKLKPLLAEKPNATRTDVWAAVSRADLFLAEPDAAWVKPPHKYAVLISDCQDNVKAPHVLPLKSGARVLVANGLASAGVLEPLQPMLFESGRAAIEWIVAAESKELR